MKKVCSSQLGQTSVEYILMLVVVVALMFSVMGMVKNFLVTESGECTPTDEALVCKIQQSFGANGNFRFFTLMR